MKKLASLVLALALWAALAVPALAADFSDVAASSAFYTGIMDCAGKGIVNGYADGTFRPAATVAKSHFCAMLARAFYPEQVAQYDTDWYKKEYGTFGPTNMTLSANGTLDGTSFRWSFNDSSAMSAGINRYDMARLMTNIMNARGFSASGEQKAEAGNAIADYGAIPEQYRDAVANVYALGIIGGYGDGSFRGTVTMNRGQAAVVIYRMQQYVPAETPEVPAETPEPETPAETPKPTTVAVTSVPVTGATGWKVADNGYSTGYLNNGKPITQENVLAMLADAKQIWPDGLTWTDVTNNVSDNNVYENGGTSKSIAAACILSHKTSPSYACGGFAAMLSDYVFGASSNPVRKLSDNTQVRPGDIVIRINPDGSVSHVNVAMTTVGKTNGGNPGVKTANGNTGGVVAWRDTASNYTDRIDNYQRAAGMSTCVIYTRYPD